MPTIYQDKYNDERKAEIRYSNASQLKESKGRLKGPSHTTIRRLDQLIPVDDLSQMFDVKELLDTVRKTAKMVTMPTVKQDKRTECNDNVEKMNLERQNNNSETESGDEWELKEDTMDKEWEGARNDITPSRTHAMKTRSQGSLNTEEAANCVKTLGR